MELTVNCRNVDLVITGNYEPEEKEIWAYRNGDPGLPGSPAMFEVCKVEINGWDIIELLSGDIIDEIEQECLKVIQE